MILLLALVLALEPFDVEVNSPEPGALNCQVWTMAPEAPGAPLEGELAGGCRIHTSICTHTGIYAKFHIDPRGASILGVCIRQDLGGIWSECVDIFGAEADGDSRPDPPDRRVLTQRERPIDLGLHRGASP